MKVLIPLLALSCSLVAVHSGTPQSFQSKTLASLKKEDRPSLGSGRSIAKPIPSKSLPFIQPNEETLSLREVDVQRMLLEECIAKLTEGDCFGDLGGERSNYFCELPDDASNATKVLTQFLNEDFLPPLMVIVNYGFTTSTFDHVCATIPYIINKLLDIIALATNPCKLAEEFQKKTKSLQKLDDMLKKLSRIQVY